MGLPRKLARNTLDLVNLLKARYPLCSWD